MVCRFDFGCNCKQFKHFKHMRPIVLDTIKIFAPAVISFVIGIAITPILSHYFYQWKLWKRKSRKIDSTTEAKDKISEEFKAIHNEDGELSTPRVGGMVIWVSVVITILLIYLNSLVIPGYVPDKLNFLSNNQTILPLFALLFASIIGLADDLLQIFGGEGMTDGISRRYRILAVLLIAAVGAWWFYFKLGDFNIHIPGSGNLNLGLLFIPFFIIVMLGVFSGGVIDGIDGLAGGVMASSYGAYMIIAFMHNQIDLAAFCAVVVGGILAFLWFNIPPARFYMGETGMLGLTVTLAIIAFLTREVLILPIIAFPLFVTSLSSSVQMFSKKYFHRKVFKVAPIHHHFEALGWPSYKVTMRYWVISIIFALIGVMIALIG
jgi:phospho-N-acetylmuramoyl-pentapeptide-transferase